MNIQGSALVLSVLALCTPASAQAPAASPAQRVQFSRSVGGTFVLRTLNASPLPAEYPPGSGSQIRGGTLELRLVRLDSGRIAMKFTSNAPLIDGARLAAEGRVQVTGDTLRFWPDGQETRPPVRMRFSWTAERSVDLTDAQGIVWGYARAAGADSGFAGVQERGREVMGVEQSTSTHLFESLFDGGRIVLQTDSTDAAGEATIRAHMRDIAERFTQGDFTLPGVVHGMPTVPGTAVMAARHTGIGYSVELLPRVPPPV